MSKIINPPIYTLIIEHKFGVNLYLCDSEKAALEQLEGFVSHWYLTETEEDRPEKLTPEDIKKYFDRTEESYNIFPHYELHEEGDEIDELD